MLQTLEKTFTLPSRPRRLRMHPQLRDLVRETVLTPHDFVPPYFVCTGTNIKNPVASMPGVYQMSIDTILLEMQELVDMGLKKILLFGIPDKKDPTGSDSYSDTGIIQRAIQEIKNRFPEILIISDLCFCEYTDHGHCGVISHQTGRADVDNDATLELLSLQAVSHAKAGADIVAPSGMVDGMVGAIRKALDQENMTHIPILSYAVKYASSFYGPFRDVAECAPKFGNRQSYQQDPGNGKEAIKEAQLDLDEGADMLMVKPALSYLDIIHRVKTTFPSIPLAAYQVSGEYAMIKAAAQNGWIDEKKVALESLLSIKRAGADFILSYYSKDAISWISNL